MDGTADFYARMYRMYNLYLRIAIGLFVGCVVSIALHFLLNAENREAFIVMIILITVFRVDERAR